MWHQCVALLERSVKLCTRPTGEKLKKKKKKTLQRLFMRLKNLDGYRRAAFCTVSLLQIQFPSFKFSALVDVEGKRYLIHDSL